jgi:hypothetical protein
VGDKETGHAICGEKKVIYVGTRAVISILAKLLVATHWDGYPSSLGSDLEGLKPGDKAEILDVADKHTIDFADLSDKDIHPYQKKRYESIAKKAGGKYTGKDIENLFKKGRQIVFGFMSCSDYPIADLGQYDDFAEFQYDIREDGIFVRELLGSYKESSLKSPSYAALEEVLKRKR